MQRYQHTYSLHHLVVLVCRLYAVRGGCWPLPTTPPRSLPTRFVLYLLCHPHHLLIAPIPALPLSKSTKGDFPSWILRPKPSKKATNCVKIFLLVNREIGFLVIRLSCLFDDPISPIGSERVFFPRRFIAF